jgi:beta-galactosidase
VRQLISISLKPTALTLLVCGAILSAITVEAPCQVPQSVPVSVPPSSRHTFRVSGTQFLLDGKPYQVISGEMHYPRVPRADWRDRFRKARAMGLNTITTYVFWNVHEPRPGVYDFAGQNDVAEYLREAQQEGLNIILRPGPYVCGEWELGGYPSWLLKDRNLVLRSNDPKYIAAMRTWFTRLAQEITPLLVRNGGPIIAVQVENEYGSIGDDHAYMEAVKSALEQSGLASDVLYTADGPDGLSAGSLPELAATVNFGTGDAKASFATLESLRPESPRMSGEYWTGWFDKWGGKHHETDGALEASELEWILSHGYSVNIYMFHGGTNFGWMNGANSDGTTFLPDTTSYDYNAPLDERGEPRQKFFAFRDAIARATHQSPPSIPADALAQAFPISPRMESASLWSNLPKPIESEPLLTMEDLDQSYGYVLYRTALEKGAGGELVLDGLHDYAQVYIDQKLAGTLDRRLGTSHLVLPVIDRPATLDILVENSGRLNYTKGIRTERKGLTGSVILGGKEPKHWKIYSLPMSDPSNLKFRAETCEGPCFYRTDMDVSVAADTYLDTRGVRKGELWIDSRPLGRIWFIGPQYSLFTPGSWLNHGQNEIVVFDLLGTQSEAIKSLDKPVYGAGISAKRE